MPLETFNSGTGQNPVCKLTPDSLGNLYGTTSAGGTYGDGTIFRIAAGTHQYTSLFSFNGSNGSNPRGGIAVDAAGNLFGTTYAGGTLGYGTLYELKAGTSSVTTLANSDDITLGHSPMGLAMDSAGDLYGTSVGSGISGHSGLFRMSAGSTTVTTTALPYYSSDAAPQGDLVFDSAGNVYGTTGGILRKLWICV